VQEFGLNRSQLAAFRFHANLDLQSASESNPCRWLLMPQELQPSLPLAMDARRWKIAGVVQRPTDRKDNLLVLRRVD
jgi:hypothetical protein